MSNEQKVQDSAGISSCGKETDREVARSHPIAECGKLPSLSPKRKQKEWITEGVLLIEGPPPAWPGRVVVEPVRRHGRSGQLIVGSTGSTSQVLGACNLTSEDSKGFYCCEPKNEDVGMNFAGARKMPDDSDYNPEIIREEGLIEVACHPDAVNCCY
ncbi:hypothetical protein HPP92_028698 [Vanilla planifolia]|uniref:Uncharacterized protein n=1 Tax=Vanilla planifolia TaxID=51239 RepID=A0A835P6G2_VANPL|nr:hypothetical protein HPP92_028698 [Vanilla planifolia]KAG0446743.1 hypothetical protein HPP92_028683 [Vanilla planifolia]